MQNKQIDNTETEVDFEDVREEQAPPVNDLPDPSKGKMVNPEDVRQPFPFYEVRNEAKRIYTFSDDDKIVVENVVAISKADDGSHRLFTKQGGGSFAIRVAAGWKAIQYIAEEGKQYVFSPMD